MKHSIAPCIAGAALMACAAGQALAQAPFPSKPLHFIVPGPGGIDAIARPLLPGIAASLGQTAIIENMPQGPRPGLTVMKSAPDGHTLFLTGRGHWLIPLEVQPAPFDPVTDFTAVSLMWVQPYLLMVNRARLPVTSVKALLDYDRANPGQINMGAGSPTATSTVAGTMFVKMAKAKVMPIPYKTGSARAAALLSGEIGMDFISASESQPFMQGDKVRALAVSSKQPSVQYPDLPSVASSVPGYDFGSTAVMFVPAKTPTAVINRLSQAVNQELKKPEIVKMLAGFSATPIGGTAQEAGDYVKFDVKPMPELLAGQMEKR